MALAFFNANALRALVLKNVNVIYMAFLAFQDSKTCASKNVNITIAKKFAIVRYTIF